MNDHLVILYIGIAAVSYEAICLRSLRKSLTDNAVTNVSNFEITYVVALLSTFHGIRYKRGFRLLIVSQF